MEHKRNFTDCFLFFFEEGILKEDEVDEGERCMGEVTNGCRILIGEVEKRCVEFRLGSFGSKRIASVANEITRMEQWRNDNDRGDRRTGNKTSPSVTFCFTNFTCSGLGSNRAFVMKAWRQIICEKHTKCFRNKSWFTLSCG
jgi:hypothetical protein